MHAESAMPNSPEEHILSRKHHDQQRNIQMLRLRESRQAGIYQEKDQMPLLRL